MLEDVFNPGTKVTFSWEQGDFEGVVDVHQRLAGWVLIKEATVPKHPVVMVRTTDVKLKPTG